MPICDFRCPTCDEEFELVLLSRDEVAACPKCGETDLTRVLSAPAPAKRIPGVIKSARRRAAAEGHFSNYSRAEKRGV